MKKLFALLMALVLSLSLVACGGTPANDNADSNPGNTPAVSDGGEQTPNKPPKTGALKIGVSINATSNQHNLDVYETLVAEGKAAGHEVVAVNANGAAAQQTTDI